MADTTEQDSKRQPTRARDEARRLYSAREADARADAIAELRRLSEVATRTALQAEAHGRLSGVEIGLAIASAMHSMRMLDVAVAARVACHVATAEVDS
jgi:hypothetical protein